MASTCPVSTFLAPICGRHASTARSSWARDSSERCSARLGCSRRISRARAFGTQLCWAHSSSAPSSTAPTCPARASPLTFPIAGGNLGVDIKNQSMGLMRSVFRSANLKGVNARGADLSRADLEFASLVEADLTGASLTGALLGGADLTGANVTGADFDNADLVSTRLIRPIGLDAARNLDKAKNLERAQRDK
jgi:uncharacterized protein YjbI with pentapeptide repeats